MAKDIGHRNHGAFNRLGADMSLEPELNPMARPSATQRRYVSYRDAAVYLGISRSTLLARLSSKNGPPQWNLTVVRLGIRSVRLDMRELEAFVAQMGKKCSESNRDEQATEKGLPKLVKHTRKALIGSTLNQKNR